jgi:DNA-binding CsgD family transcriptional regulator
MSLAPTSPGSLGSSIDALSDRQFECLRLAATGLSSPGIAEQIGISPRTVDEHLAAACEALGVRTRIQAVARFAKVERELSELRSFLP